MEPAAGQPDPSEGKAQPQQQRQFAVEDYFRLYRVGGLALSSDGAWLAYSTSTTSLEKDALVAQNSVQSLTTATPAQSPKALDNAWGLAWIPGTHRLAFLSAASGTAQVKSLDVESGEVRQLTRSADGIAGFRFAPGGRRFAYVTRAPAKPGTSLYDQFRTAWAGILINPDTISSHDFVNPDWNAMVSRQPARLWVTDLGGQPSEVPVPGEALGDDGTYFWSSDGSVLSTSYIATDNRVSQLGGDRTSVGIFEVASAAFSPLASGRAPSAAQPGISYAGGEWIPGGLRLLLRRVVESDPWTSGSFPNWSIADASGPLPVGKAWQPAEFYPRNLNFFPLGGHRILVEHTVQGVHSLFVLGGSKPASSNVVARLDGSSSNFQFSADGRTAVFVNESLTRPPEIFLKHRNAPARRLTAFNQDVAKQVAFKAKEVCWQSTDGLTIRGWLLEPRGRADRPLPLVTQVHGGPAFPFPNAFAPYFPMWPYPLEAYPSRGIAVFLPNYRGTHSYGRRIASATGDDQAIDDILSGVRALVDRGLADPKRLGISGHSHGALLGPLVMAKSKMFRASSFAEGVSNQIVMYELMSGDANRYIHDPTMGVSLYDSPQAYINGSADLQLKGVRTASLFEAGAKTSAIFMLGLAKSAERFGLPSEFVIYPKTAHNLAIPSLQMESAQRNLDWFDFWLSGHEDPNPSKIEQYGRWRRSMSSRK